MSGFYFSFCTGCEHIRPDPSVLAFNICGPAKKGKCAEYAKLQKRMRQSKTLRARAYDRWPCNMCGRWVSLELRERRERIEAGEPAEKVMAEFAVRRLPVEKGVDA